MRLAADFEKLPPSQKETERTQKLVRPIIEHMRVSESNGSPLRRPKETAKRRATWDPATPDPDLTAAAEPGFAKDGCIRNAKLRVTGTPERIKALKAATVALAPSWMDMALEHESDDDDERDGLRSVQSKYPNLLHRLMSPSGRALRHPFGSVLLDYADNGCPANTGPNWTREMLEAAVNAGPQPSARAPAAAKACREEAFQKVQEGYCKIHKWADLKDDLPAKLKISPIAAIPHKSRDYRMILNLAKGVKEAGVQHPSVNDTTDPSLAVTEAMNELGYALPRLIYAAALTDESKGPILFSKFDIKDGFWRMSVPEDDEWSFAYVLPKLDPNEETQIVVPSSLQMGWVKSPPYFCSATETARDVGDERMHEPIGSLPTHPLEDRTVDATYLAHLRSNLPPLESQEDLDNFTRLLEVYVDDFVGMAQTTDENHLRHMSRAILTSIHEVFPPPSVTGQPDTDDPISLKKLEIWEVRKEILGWIFDGIHRCIKLPSDKVDRLLDELKAVGRMKRVEVKRLEKLRGRLRHAAIGIPGGRGLVSPFDRALNTDGPFVIVSDELQDACRDFRALLRIVGTKPTHFRQLVADEPGYVGFCDASGKGAGGVWMPWETEVDLEPVVWRVQWPQDITDSICSVSNPTGPITNSDLEMAGMLLHYLVLEQLVDLKHVHVAAWCDNTPTVSWTNKLNSSKSRIAAKLVRALALRIQANEASPLISLSIAGIENEMADVASRAFGKAQAHPRLNYLAADDFLLMFNSTFPLPQGNSWTMFQLNDKLSTLVISELRNIPSNLGSWLRITKNGGSIGRIGGSSPGTVEWSPGSNARQQRKRSRPSPVTLSGSGQVTSAEATKSGLKRFKSRFAPSARPANWKGSQTQSTEAKESTSRR